MLENFNIICSYANEREVVINYSLLRETVFGANCLNVFMNLFLDAYSDGLLYRANKYKIRWYHDKFVLWGEFVVLFLKGK